MTDLGLGKIYDLMRDQNREHNRIATSLREYPITCSWCKNKVIGYGPIPYLHGPCEDCINKTVKLNQSRDKTTK